jgi:H+-translocating NAD(P) transhydrogenase subunit alpha
MKLGLLREMDETRVAIVPEGLKKLQSLGLEFLIEKSAGISAMFSDSEYAENGKIVDREAVLSESDLVISINPLSDDDLKKLKKNTLVIGQYQPFMDGEIAGKLRSMGLRGMSMDMIPRTTLAQSMDVLSSMASIAGYKAVLEAARLLPRYFPMMITAAGSLKPAKILVLGAGVAGLQAIATAKRLGAQVEAFDTRRAAKEEVESLGAKFVEVEGAVDDTSAGGYAVAQSEAFLNKQRAEVQARAIKSDVIIATAQVRGRKAPVLVDAETVEQMQPGSVIIDLAASTGGNCALTQDRQLINHRGVIILGDSNLPALMPQDASKLYSNNLLNFLKYWIKGGEMYLNMEDEIIKGAFFTGE